MQDGFSNLPRRFRAFPPFRTGWKTRPAIVGGDGDAEP